MPYLQRPRNINEKLVAMKEAMRKAKDVAEENKILSFSKESYNKLVSFLPLFEKEVDEIKIILDNQTESMWLKQKNLRLLRMFVEHFILVFNHAVVRGVFNVSERAYYGLDVNTDALPFIKGEADTIMWVNKLINGEEQRTKEGLNPMCNPSIDEIKAVLTKFDTLDKASSKLKGEYSRGLGDISIVINEADELIRDIWDEIEFFYRKESMASKITLCSEYGLVFVTEIGDKEISGGLTDE